MTWTEQWVKRHRWRQGTGSVLEKEGATERACVTREFVNSVYRQTALLCPLLSNGTSSFCCRLLWGISYKCKSWKPPHHSFQLFNILPQLIWATATSGSLELYPPWERGEVPAPPGNAGRGKSSKQRWGGGAAPAGPQSSAWDCWEDDEQLRGPLRTSLKA